MLKINHISLKFISNNAKEYEACQHESIVFEDILNSIKLKKIVKRKTGLYLIIGEYKILLSKTKTRKEVVGKKELSGEIFYTFKSNWYNIPKSLNRKCEINLNWIESKKTEVDKLHITKIKTSQGDYISLFKTKSLKSNYNHILKNISPTSIKNGRDKIYIKSDFEILLNNIKIFYDEPHAIGFIITHSSMSHAKIESLDNWNPFNV